MKNKYIYITSSEWFETGTLKNPIVFLDQKIQNTYPELYSLVYDVKLLVTKPPTHFEKSVPFYNDYRERYGNSDISVLESATKAGPAKNIFLNGFCQEHFEYIAPFIKDTVEVLYFFKCPKIHDLSVLSEFKKLKCVFMYWNNSLESLWDMSNNKDLKVVSFLYITKLLEIDYLINSNVEYITFDSSDNSGNRKDMLFNKSIFDEIPKLKHLTLTYKSYDIDY